MNKIAKYSIYALLPIATFLGGIGISKLYHDFLSDCSFEKEINSGALAQNKELREKNKQVQNERSTMKKTYDSLLAIIDSVASDKAEEICSGSKKYTKHDIKTILESYNDLFFSNQGMFNIGELAASLFEKGFYLERGYDNFYVEKVPENKEGLYDSYDFANFTYVPLLIYSYAKQEQKETNSVNNKSIIELASAFKEGKEAKIELCYMGEEMPKINPANDTTNSEK